LISSTTYPKPFSFEQLEFLRHEIQARRSGTHARLVELDPSEEERMKREKKERKRREKDRAAEAEAAALAERRAAESGVKVKRERTSCEWEDWLISGVADVQYPQRLLLLPRALCP
jgi:hypothetical protein